jgi:hypothetical protein
MAADEKLGPARGGRFLVATCSHGCQWPSSNMRATHSALHQDPYRLVPNGEFFRKDQWGDRFR